jgi:hypothetical protein
MFGIRKRSRMQVMTVKEALQSQLRKTAEDPTTVASVEKTLLTGLDKNASRPVSFTSQHSLEHLVSPLHPVLSEARIGGAQSDFETLKKIAEDLVFPFLQPSNPNEKLFITGVQIVFATIDFWSSISNKELSADAKTLKGVSIAQKAAGAFLAYHEINGLPRSLNSISGYIISTANKVLAVTDA